ncbi:MAG: hypothetical protein EOO23_07895 [Comamonadaceae bacterium]|nr:MAG: hypothetical protein EOO23_07895 [Comamonadaceae bacterium]
MIANAAKGALYPLGFRRKGRSRLWLLDRAWWLAVVEFQPSGWAKGSYLNVAAHWLWSEHEFLSFDVCNRVGGFAEYASDAQFASAALELADTAAIEAARLTKRFSSIDATADDLVAEETATKRSLGSWSRYNAGVAAGLVGRSAKAAALLCGVTDHRVKPSAETMARLANDPASFRKKTADLIARQRLALGLSPIDDLRF